MNKKRVLITGASKGIGRAISTELVNNGYTVIGTARNVAAIENKINGVEYIVLDLLDDKSIQACVQQIGSIDVLINNAGMSAIGAVEDATVENIKQLFQVNLFGIISLTQGFLPGMIKNKSGYIINIGSMAGKFAVPFQSAYVASKFALSGLTQVLRNEVKKYGVKAVLIEPNDIRTTIDPEILIPKNSRYERDLSKMMAAREESMANARPPAVVAKKVLKILNKKNPKPCYTVGGMGPLMVFMKRFLPDRAVEYLVRKNYGL